MYNWAKKNIWINNGQKFSKFVKNKSVCDKETHYIHWNTIWMMADLSPEKTEATRQWNKIFKYWGGGKEIPRQAKILYALKMPFKNEG